MTFSRVLPKNCLKYHQLANLERIMKGRRVHFIEKQKKNISRQAWYYLEHKTILKT